MKTVIRTLSIFCLLPLLGVAELASKEGFGMKKATVQLDRVRPADVYIAGTRVDVRADSSHAGDPLQKQLVTLLESELLGNDSRLILDERGPDTVVEVALVDNDYSEGWETRTVKKSVPAGKDSKGRQQYVLVDKRIKFKVLSHVFAVTYKVTDKRSASVLAAETISRQWSEDFEEGRGAPNRAELERRSIDSTVAEIARGLTPTRESIGVLLPGGSLKELRNLARGGLWNPYLEALEAQPPRSKPKEESYREYSLGVAYEALGYLAEEAAISIRYLEESTAHYQRAIQFNPGEKLFSVGFKGNGLVAMAKGLMSLDAERKQAMAPIDRARSALEQFQRVIEFSDADAASANAVASTRPLGGRLSGAKGLGSKAEPALTNAAVIEMSRAGLSDEIILSAIKSADQVALDTSPMGLVELARAEVSSGIIEGIQNFDAKRR